MPKLEQLLELLKSEPNDIFLRYALAMEYMKTRQLDQAIAEFRQLMERHPDYVPAYFMGGRALEQKGDFPAARATYQQGIATARRIGDTHAANEIGDALAAVEEAGA